MRVFDGRISSAGWVFLSWGLAAVFLYAGVTKLWEIGPLATSIARFRIVPDFLVHPIALGLPPLEILCAVTLLCGPWKRQAALGIAVLCLVFLAAILSAAVRGIPVECSCFGSSAAEPLWRLIVRDMILLTAACALYLRALLRVESPAYEFRADGGVLNRTSRCLH